MKQYNYIIFFAFIIILILSAGVFASQSPKISLNLPADNYLEYMNVSNFSFSVRSNNDILWCRLHLNDSVFKIKSTIDVNKTNYFYEVSVQNGTWVWRVECMDNQSQIGSSSNRTLSIEIDRKPPIIHIYPLNSTVNGTGYSILRFKPIQQKTKITSCKLILNGEINTTRKTIFNNTEQSFALNLPRGTHTWQINCTDKMGNEGKSSVGMLEVDYIPVIKITEPENNTLFYRRHIDFTYVPMGYNNLANCVLMLNKTIKDQKTPGYVFNESSSNIINGTENYFKNIPLTNGTWLWKINCSDIKGNRGVSKIQNFSVWLQLPVTDLINIHLISPADNFTDTEGTISFNYTPVSNSEIKSCTLLTNGSTRARSTSIGKNRINSFKNIELGNGLWEWTVSCEDIYGNVYSTDERELVISREAVVESPVFEEEIDEFLPPLLDEGALVLIAVFALSIILIFLVLLIHEDTRYFLIGRFLIDEEKPKLNELEKYINGHLDRGFTEEEIERQLKEFNWDSKKINSAFSKVRKNRGEIE